jgi:hypothetical protein
VLPLVCIDVDGTLVGATGAPSARVWAAAEAAVARGQRLALCTARPALGVTATWAKRLDPGGWHIYQNGAALLGPDRMVGHELAPAAVAACGALARERGWVLEHYSAADYVVDSDDDLAVRHAELMALPHRRRPVATLSGPAVRVQFVVPLGAAPDVLAQRPEATAASFATSPIMADAAFVSITEAGVTKAGAVVEVAGLLGVPLAEVMMVGDGHNDLEALGAVGHGVAMGNAEPACRAAARHHVAHVDDDGLAEALELSATL